MADSATFIVENRISELNLNDARISLNTFVNALGRHRDGRLDWFRASRIIDQEAELLACREQVTNMRISRFSPADWVDTDHADSLTKLLELLDSLRATGRLTEYGRLDALRLRADGFVNRRLRDGDIIQLRTDELHEVFVWNVQDGFLAKPHAPSKFAYAYVGYSLADGVVRGDYAYSISPDGDVTLLGIATHNQSNLVIEPGTLLFLPPPGFGRSEQKAFSCIAQVLSYQDMNAFDITRQRRD